MNATPSVRLRNSPAARGLLVVAVLAGLTGCENPPKSSTGQYKGFFGAHGVPAAPSPTIDVLDVPTHDDIVSVVKFWPQSPWIPDASGVPTGFSVPVYFVSAETQKGVFVKGTMHVWLYQVVRDQRGRPSRALQYEWVIPPDELVNFRVRKKSIMGYYHGLALRWPKDLDVLGKEIIIQLGYEREDGRMIRETGRNFRVPLSGEAPA